MGTKGIIKPSHKNIGTVIIISFLRILSIYRPIKETYSHYLTFTMTSKYRIIQVWPMNILVHGTILNYPDTHLLGKTSLDPTMVSVFHLVVYQTMISQI